MGVHSELDWEAFQPEFTTSHVDTSWSNQNAAKVHPTLVSNFELRVREVRDTGRRHLVI